MRQATVTLLAGPVLLAACNSGTTLSLAPPPAAIEGLRTEGDRSLLLTFTGGSPRLEPSDPCWEGYRPDVVETPTTVTVTIQRIPSSAPMPELSACTTEGYQRAVVIELPGPIGERRIVDGATGRERRPFDGSTLLAPRALPQGWGLLAERPGFDGPEPSTSWLRTWGPEPAPRAPGECADAPRVDLLQGRGGALGPGEPVDVRGTTGVVTRPPGQVRLAWNEPGGRRELIGWRTCAGDPVELDLLLGFAQSLS
ncbi:MAG: hypothetical protein M3203_07585 [Actinomycetota bacterium]|nr:hypothetical protein [Actinomycetota bacterium]